MSVRRARRAALAGAIAAVLAMAPRPAGASDADVTSDTTAQFYDVASPTGQTVLERRRLTSMLGAGEYNLFDAPPGDPHAGEVNFRLRLRYDADYGISPEEVNAPNYGYGKFVPGLSQQNLDLMYAYLEGRRFFNGLVGFKLGRQYVTDVLGWWAFDGAEVGVTTPYYLKGEIYGGLEERGGFGLSTPRFESDGVWRGQRNSFDPNSFPEFQPAAIAPAIGVALESTGVTWIHGRLTYRRVYDTGSSNVTEFATGLYTPMLYTGTRISSEKLGYAMDATAASVGGIKAGIVYDLYRAEITSAYASLDAFLGQSVTLSADYDLYVPSYDADSIWNFFLGEPRNDAGLRANVNVDEHLSLAANGHVRMFMVQTAQLDTGGATAMNFSDNTAVYPTNGHPFDEGGDFSLRWKDGETRMDVHAAGDVGDEGNRVGGDGSIQHVFESRYVASGRVGVWQWDDKLLPDRTTTSFQYVADLGYRFAPRSQGSIDWEHDINGLVGQRFRLMLSLSLGLTK
jgi:hypothetical protein